jgi:hypothetical protein
VKPSRRARSSSSRIACSAFAAFCGATSAPIVHVVRRSRDPSARPDPAPELTPSFWRNRSIKRFDRPAPPPKMSFASISAGASDRRRAAEIDPRRITRSPVRRVDDHRAGLTSRYSRSSLAYGPSTGTSEQFVHETFDLLSSKSPTIAISPAPFEEIT